MITTSPACCMRRASISRPWASARARPRTPGRSGAPSPRTGTCSRARPRGIGSPTNSPTLFGMTHELVRRDRGCLYDAISSGWPTRLPPAGAVRAVPHRSARHDRRPAWTTSRRTRPSPRTRRSPAACSPPSGPTPTSTPRLPDFRARIERLTDAHGTPPDDFAGYLSRPGGRGGRTSSRTARCPPITACASPTPST